MPLKVYQQITIAICNFCLGIGIALIIKGYGSELGWWSLDTGSFWTKFGEWSDASIAIVGTCLISSSIYIEDLNKISRPADWISHRILAPGVILCGVGSLMWMISLQKVVPDVVNGFAVLGLIGAIIRLLPFSEGMPHNMPRN